MKRVDAMENAESIFVVKFPASHFDACFRDAASSLPIEVTGPLLAFQDNLGAVVRIVLLPYQLSGAAVQHRRIDQLYRSELIRSLDLEDPSRDISPEKHAAAMAKALDAFRAESQAEQGQKALREQAIADLSGRLHIPEITIAAADLLRQATSMIWTSFEVLFRDLVTGVLNASPSLVSRLLRDDRSRQILDLRRMDTEVLAAHGFDLKDKMGDIIGSHDALARLDTMRIMFTALCPAEKPVGEMLNDPLLWLLAQRRHLIVHRRGIVDSQYLDRTGDSRPKGSLLALTPAEVVEQLLLVQRVGLAVLRAFNDLAGLPRRQVATAEGDAQV